MVQKYTLIMHLLLFTLKVPKMKIVEFAKSDVDEATDMSHFIWIFTVCPLVVDI